MVTFWPWKGDDSSPASFEKALSALSAKISKTTSKLDSLRQRSRRLSVLWTLYAGFAYLLYTIILALVVGWKNWGPPEYVAVAGGPIVIYTVRLGLTSYYGYRTSRIQAQLDDLQKQRDNTIEKLKTATKYNSTQELLKKYGGTPTPKAKPEGVPDRKSTQKQEASSTSKNSRTSFVPPPTANIPGRDRPLPPRTSNQHPTPQAGSPLDQQGLPTVPGRPHSPQSPGSPYDTSAEFAPNAFPAAPQYAQVSEGSRWYDRIMDVLLGEDETRPGARLALICTKCRLVNGQAPPGVKHLEDVGQWRCGGCGTMNGEENEVKRIVTSIKQQASSQEWQANKEKPENFPAERRSANDEATLTPSDDDHETDVTQYSSDEEEPREVKETMLEATTPVAEPGAARRRSTRPNKGKKITG